MVRRWIGMFVVAALIAAACGDAGEPAPAPVGTVPPLAEDTVPGAARLEALCDGVVAALIAGDTSAFISTMEDIHGVMSGAAGGEQVVELLVDIGNQMPSFEDRPLSPETLTAVASELIEVSNRLHDRGAVECAGIGEFAAEFEGLPPPDPVSAADQLARNRRLWEERAPATYAMELGYHDEGSSEPICGQGNVLVQVVDNLLTVAVDRYFGCEVPDDGAVPNSVDDLFELVEANVDADVLDVDYEPELGYPRRVFIQREGGIVEAGVVVFTRGVVTVEAGSVLDELQAQRARWSDLGPADYEMTVELFCFCPPEWAGPFDVTVTTGEIKRVLRNGDDVTSTAEPTYLTVLALFAAIEDQAYADSIEVTYHPLGYPTLIDIDPSFNAIDEELIIVVSRLEPGG